MSLTVPSGWREVELRDLLAESEQRVGDRSDLPLLSVTKHDGVVLAKDRFSRVLASKDLSRYRVAPRDAVVIDPMLLWDGVIALQHRFAEGVVSPDYRVFRFTSETDPAFFDYLAHATVMRRQYARAARGTNVRRRRISRDDFLAIRVVVPPVVEQHAIAATLTSVDGAMAAGEALVEQLDRARRALLTKLMERGVCEAPRLRTTPTGRAPDHWEEVTVSDLATDISYGTSLPLNADGDGVPVLRIPNVVGGTVDSDLKFRRFSENEIESLRLMPDDLLVVRTNGNPAYVGRTLLFPKREGVWAFASYLIRVRVDCERVLPAYLHYALQSPGVRRCVEHGIRTSAGNYNLNTQGIRSTPLNLPPLDEQRAIVEALDTISERCRRERAVLDQRRIVRTALAEALLSGRLRVRDAA